ncbi:MAG TPA: hypothetical protein VI566_06835 [Xanthomonadales bacterium]|nr:hypothetical protein [Xanthomonadales bacterium]
MTEIGRHGLLLACSAVLALVTPPARAEPLAAGVQWKDPSSVDLKVDFPGEGYNASWQLFRCTCGDLLIRSELAVPGEVVHGEILLVGNRAVLMRGFDPGSAELVSIDAPALMMQLALRLLERAQAQGPSAVDQRQEVAVEDTINFIHLESGAAVGGFPAPWSVKGSIWPQGDSQRRFDLLFKFNAGGAAGSEEQAGEIGLSGVAEYAASEFPLAADMETSAWDLSWREENDAAAAGAGSVKNLADLRQLLKKD